MNINTKLCPESEYDPAFIQGMIDRMAVSLHAYGNVADAKGKVDVVASLKLRLQKYEDTGNTEFLMDVANFAMMEFMHQPWSCQPTDSNASPGRVWLKDMDFGDDVQEVSRRANDGSI